MPPSVTRPCTAFGSVFSQTANFAASAACFESVVTAVVEPPQNPLTFAPAVHCGSGAIAHLPTVSGAELEIVPGAHAALIQLTSAPSSSALFQAGVQSGCGSI